MILKLDGVSQHSSAALLQSGRLFDFVPAVDVGAAVAAEQEVGHSVVDPGVAAALEAAAEPGNLDEGRLEHLRSLEGPVVTSIAGSFELVDGRPIVLSPGIDVVVSLSPIQDLRYQSLRFTGRATIETSVGQREVVCESVWIDPRETSAALAEDAVADVSELHCRLPRHVETAAGLRAQVRLESEVYEDSVLVPGVYVGYDDETDGHFITIIQAGEPARIPVVVGVTDGVMRVITSEVPVGAQLVPLGDGR